MLLESVALWLLVWLLTPGETPGGFGTQPELRAPSWHVTFELELPAAYRSLPLPLLTAA